MGRRSCSTLALLVTAALTLVACGGQRTSGEGATDTRTVGSQGDGPADADADGDTDASFGFEAGPPLDGGADAAPDPFADASACGTRPVADCNTCDADSCPMPMLAIAQAMIDACKPPSCPTVEIVFSQNGCATAIRTKIDEGSAFIDCMAAKLSAQRFPLPDCTFALVKVTIGGDCTVK